MSACFDDVPVVEVATPAFVEVTPTLTTEVGDDRLATFRWDVLASPEGSLVSGADSVVSRPAFQFNRRGTYLLDRWILAGLSERLTHHVVVTVTGAAPVAMVSGTTFVAIGEEAGLDARTSSSRELRTLTYRWQLSARPTLSQLVLPLDDIDNDTLSIVPDVAGFYAVEVVAFDGELWSEPATIMVEGHN